MFAGLDYATTFVQVCGLDDLPTRDLGKLLEQCSRGVAETRAREVLTERPDLIAELEHRGRERALTYKMLVLTGLRLNELRSLTVGQLELEGRVAFAVLAPADEKAGRGAEIPLRPDLVADLRDWLGERLDAARDAAKAKGLPLPARLPDDAPLLNVPTGLVTALNRDLRVAGIPKRDDRGRVLDIHALRHTFGTHLSKGGVAPRVAQAAMRHSTLELTMNTYTDPRLLDVAGALDVLPALPLDAGPGAERQRATRTGGPAEGSLENLASFAPKFAQLAGKTLHSPGRAGADWQDDFARHAQRGPVADVAETPCFMLEKHSVATAGNVGQSSPSGCKGKRATGLEPATFSLEVNPGRA